MLCGALNTWDFVCVTMSHAKYHIYLAIRQGFPLSSMTKSNLFSPAVLQVLPFLNNPKYLTLSYTTDLDFWDCFGRKIAPPYNRRNMVVVTMASYTLSGDSQVTSWVWLKAM